MVSDIRLRFSSPSPFLVSGDVPRFPDQPKVRHSNDEGSLRMGDEGCPNEGSSVDDADGTPKKKTTKLL